MGGYIHRRDKGALRGDSYMPHGKENVGDYFEYNKKEESGEGHVEFDFSERAIIGRLKWLFDHHYFFHGDFSSIYKTLLLNQVDSDTKNTEKEFNELAEKWRKETGGYSTMIHIAGNNNYLDIIGMGQKVVPFILKDLEREADYWFVALKHITKANPVPKSHLGDIEKMREDWLEWGRKNNLI